MKKILVMILVAAALMALFAGCSTTQIAADATRIITDVVKYAKRTENPEIMKLVGHLMSLYDISSLGGGIILGSRKPLIKMRGSSGKDAIVNTTEMIINIAENKEAFNKAKSSI